MGPWGCLGRVGIWTREDRCGEDVVCFEDGAVWGEDGG